MSRKGIFKNLAIIIMACILVLIIMPGAALATTPSDCGIVTDYDGNTYGTLAEGSLCWLASNLKSTHDVFGSAITRYCYGNDPANCDLRGGLYYWDTVMNGEPPCDGTDLNDPACIKPVQGICPVDWHVPSSYEYMNLGNIIAPGKYGWEAQDAFVGSTWSNGIPGWRDDYGYYDWDIYADYWSSTKTGTNPSRFAYGNGLYYNTDSWYPPPYGFSVRCVKNSGPTPLAAKILEPKPNQFLKRGKTIDDIVSVKFSGSAIGGSSPYIYTWYLDGISVPVTGKDAYYDVSYGKHRLQLVVVDSTGAMASSNEINFEIVTTIAVVPVKLGIDTHQSTDETLRIRMKDVENYYSQQSYGKEKIVPKLLIGWDGAKVLDSYDQYLIKYSGASGFICDASKAMDCKEQIDLKNKTQIIKDATQGENLEQYNAVVVVFASDNNLDDGVGTEVTPISCISNSRYPELGGDTERCGLVPWVLIRENRLVSVWIHEIGHAAFDFMDRYPIIEVDELTKEYKKGASPGGDINYWGIMGQASISTNTVIGANPVSPMDPISKRDAGWIEEKPLYLGNHQPINLISDNINPGIYFFDPGPTEEYKFVIEGRYPPDSVLSDSWCSVAGNCPISEDGRGHIYLNPINVTPTKGVMLYRYEKDISKKYSAIYDMDRLFYVPSFADTEGDNKVTLISDSPFARRTDCMTGTEFYVTEEVGQLYLDISKVACIATKMFVEDGLPEKSLGSVAGATSLQSIPDIDLKVYNSAGQMVGMNYTSGLYEIGIEGANVSGNMHGSSEWISYPDSMDLYAVLDTTPLKKWAEEVNVTLPENITVPMNMVEYDSNGIRTETSPVNITVNTTIPTIVTLEMLQLSEIRYINGTVVDSINKIPIVGVKVFVNSSILAITDAAGAYSLTVAEGSYNLTAKYDPIYYINNTVIVSIVGKSVVTQTIELVEKPKGNIQGGVTRK